MLKGASSSIVSYLALALGVLVAPPLAQAQRDEWRELRIDGSSVARFEATVASLQNALPNQRRDDFEVALAAIWLGTATKAGDIDQDGAIEVDDILTLNAGTADVLTALQRGDLVSVIEELDQSADDRLVVDYFAQLDGLGYDAVLDLAGRPGESPEVGQAVKAAKAQVLCRGEQLPVRRKWCDAFFRSNAATPVPRPGEALATAVEALQAGNIALAESAVGSLNPEELSSFDRGIAATIQFHIAYRQQLYPEAREHLQAAVDTELMTAAQADAIVAVLDRFERMSQRPRPRRLGGERPPENESALSE